MQLCAIKSKKNYEQLKVETIQTITHKYCNKLWANIKAQQNTPSQTELESNNNPCSSPLSPEIFSLYNSRRDFPPPAIFYLNTHQKQRRNPVIFRSKAILPTKMSKNTQVEAKRVFIGAGCNRVVNNVSWGASGLVSFGAQNAVAIFCPKVSLFHSSSRTLLLFSQ